VTSLFFSSRFTLIFSWLDTLFQFITLKMFSSIVSRSTRLARPNFIRRGGHGPVSYNEPSGYLFNEKVMQKSIFFFL
jgi:hypothetical protein